MVELGLVSRHGGPPRRLLARTGWAMGWSWQMRPGP
jgi:hypothetical protein